MDVLSVPTHRRERMLAIIGRLRDAERIVLTTHVNADGDGTGSEVAVAAWLEAIGKEVHIVNPTAFPAMYQHLLPSDCDWVRDPADSRTAATVRAADVALVLDTSEPKRIGRVASSIAGKPTLVIDHHVPPDTAIEGLVVEDATACATGELIYDLLSLAEWKRPWSSTIIEGIYTAIVTDTGSFRFSNSTRRAHAIAGDLIEQGIDPEAVYRRIFATVPLRRLQLLRHALDQLKVDDDFPITWITVDRNTMDSLQASSEDLEGLIDHARSIEGTEVAILFRETADGSTKISLRSSGAVDVNAIARELGGGGHVKASGALISDRLPDAQKRVLDAVRATMREKHPDFRASHGNH